MPGLVHWHTNIGIINVISYTSCCNMSEYPCEKNAQVQCSHIQLVCLTSSMTLNEDYSENYSKYSDSTHFWPWPFPLRNYIFSFFCSRIWRAVPLRIKSFNQIISTSCEFSFYIVICFTGTCGSGSFSVALWLLAWVMVNLAQIWTAEGKHIYTTHCTRALLI